MADAGIPIVTAVDIGHKDQNQLTLLRLNFPIGDPMTFALPTAVALEMAHAILAQQEPHLGKVKN
jgi:hypothetical protein